MLVNTKFWFPVKCVEKRFTASLNAIIVVVIVITKKCFYSATILSDIGVIEVA